MSIRLGLAGKQISIQIMSGGDWDGDLEKIKEIPGRSYKDRLWYVKANQVEDISTRWSDDEIFFQDKAIQDHYEKFFKKDTRPLYALAPIEQDIDTFLPLKDYQMEYVKLNENVKHVILSLPTGAGKSVTSLERLKILCKISATTLNRLLIVCPKRVRTNWRLWVRNVLGFNSTIFWAENKKQRRKLLENLRDDSVIITTYECLKELHDFLGPVFSDIIVDECHLACNSKSKRFKDTNEIITDNKPTTLQLLSGTPIQHKIKDFWGVVYHVAPDIAGAEKSWCNRYEKVLKSIKKRIPIKNKAGEALRDTEGNIRYREIEIPIKTATQNLDELARRVAPILYRVKKEDVFSFDSPIEPVFIEMSDIQRQIYERVRDEILIELDERTISVAEAPVRMLRLLQVCEGMFNLEPTSRLSSKFDFCCDVIRELDPEADETALFWSRFQPITNLLQAEFPDKVVVYNGSQPDYMNQLAVWAFNGVGDSIELQEFNTLLKRAEKNGYYFPFGPGTATAMAGVLDLRSALGIDLHKRCYRQYLPSFSYMGVVNDQAMARLIRLGQLSKYVLTQPILIEDTIEAAVWKMGLENLKTSQLVLDGKESLSVRESEQLIRILSRR